MYHCSAKLITPWLTNGLQICSYYQCFYYDLVGYILQSCGLDIMVTTGPNKTAEACLLVTLAKGRAVFYAYEMLRRQLYTYE